LQDKNLLVHNKIIKLGVAKLLSSPSQRSIQQYQKIEKLSRNPYVQKYQLRHNNQEKSSLIPTKDLEWNCFKERSDEAHLIS